MNLGAREGPPTEAEAAAEHYRRTLGWPVGGCGHEVWLCLPSDMAALVVPKPLVARLILGGPMIDRPGEPPSRVLLVRSPVPIREDASEVLRRLGIGCLSHRCLVDLPPTRRPDGVLTWVQPPSPGVELTPLAEIVDLLRRFDRNGDHRR